MEIPIQPAQHKSPKTPVDNFATDEILAQLCKALAHPARVAIVRFLLKQNRCICGQIVDMLPLAQSTVSQHLKILKDSGLVRGEVDGPRCCYCLDLDSLKTLKKAVLEL